MTLQASYAGLVFGTVDTVLEESCASCGSERLADGRFCLFCGDLLAEPSERASSQVRQRSVSTISPDYEYAGFGLRFLAGAVDVALEALGALVITVVLDLILRHFGRFVGIDRWDAKVFAGFAYIPILAVGSWLYCAFMESSSWQATVGKRLLWLQVITTGGERISFGAATARHFMKFLSLFCLMIGFLMPLWTKRRQALHDMPSDMLVIRAPAP